MKKPHNQVTIKLPFRIGNILSIKTKRRIGFLFDNFVPHAVFLASECKDAKEFNEWCKLDGGALLNFETIYQAAVNYRKEIRKKDNFTRVGLKRALLEADEKQVKLLTDCIKRSEMYGATYKKKVVKKKPKQ